MGGFNSTETTPRCTVHHVAVWHAICMARDTVGRRRCHILLAWVHTFAIAASLQPLRRVTMRLAVVLLAAVAGGACLRSAASVDTSAAAAAPKPHGAATASLAKEKGT